MILSPAMRALEPRRMIPRGVECVVLGMLVLLAAGTSSHAQVPASEGAASEVTAQVWLDPQGQPVHFSSLEDLQTFLQTATIRKTKAIPVGVTDPKKLLLEQDGRRLHAQFQPFEKVHEKIRLADDRVEFNYRDSYKFNMAAYNLSVLLGMDNVPPSFPRRIGGEEGSVTVWLEEVMTERTRTKDKHRPPAPLAWSRQLSYMRVFDELIANDDRNQGNILIDKDWKVWLIDHTRAFRPRRELYDPEALRGCERRLWSKLRALSDDELREAVSEWLTDKELETLLERRRLLVAHFDELIAAQGEELVLFDLS